MSLKKLRLTITVRLYKNHKLVHYANRRVKSRVLELVQRVSRAEWDLGYIKVTYNVKKDYYNHAYFKNFSQLKRLVSEFTEWELVKLFK